MIINLLTICQLVLFFYFGFGVKYDWDTRFGSIFTEATAPLSTAEAMVSDRVCIVGLLF